MPDPTLDTAPKIPTLDKLGLASMALPIVGFFVAAIGLRRALKKRYQPYTGLRVVLMCLALLANLTLMTWLTYKTSKNELWFQTKPVLAAAVKQPPAINDRIQIVAQPVTAPSQPAPPPKAPAPTPLALVPIRIPQPAEVSASAKNIPSPAQRRSIYIASCAGKVSEACCNCIYDQIETAIPYQDFVKIVVKSPESKPLMEKFKSVQSIAMGSCQKLHP